ncbi:isoprenoid biosynthesis glyoxalase ElbB [Candidatus Fermentibacterales bacterium]|nr:isoprenoid biosynthesis glyoxalase ElbB [Candidatus Fermentibacterales bacterium]
MAARRRVAVVLSGSGVKDGSEIHEAVSAIIALDRAGYEVVFTAPDVDQAATVDHLSGQPAEGERRNVLRESARIARGEIRPLSRLRPEDYDAVVFPGGFGAATNRCSFAEEGASCGVLPEIEKLVRRASDDGKPIAAMCIAPVILARCLGNGVRLTIGTDRGTASALEKMGAVHVDCPVDSSVVDETRRVVTTPAYMLANGPAQVMAGAESLVRELGRLLESA